MTEVSKFETCFFKLKSVVVFFLKQFFFVILVNFIYFVIYLDLFLILRGTLGMSLVGVLIKKVITPVLKVIGLCGIFSLILQFCC